ncbi:hypothetical protein DUNSADRAFT_16472 [Dunaliella salina]|uniref:Encoded protein n=1 Tax=Dunaliella salina TaxID=3046 RepID=A0ABQ7H0Z9_DUNSA|nr:hypothetical protein DUNSADRAFT_16472 [Dunaliella salina]|eukprot:KAF5840531.1 hypothetical protein DUNSADRAFT_16472 [Dunaliella salina]
MTLLAASVRNSRQEEAPGLHLLRKMRAPNARCPRCDESAVVTFQPLPRLHSHLPQRDMSFGNGFFLVNLRLFDHFARSYVGNLLHTGFGVIQSWKR